MDTLVGLLIFAGLATSIIVLILKMTGAASPWEGQPTPKRPPPEDIGIDISIPGTGTPGTATTPQTEALARNGISIPREQLSHEDASLILDTLGYVRAVYATIVGHDGKPPMATQNLGIAFVLRDGELSTYVNRWGRDRFRRGTHNSPPRLKRNEHYTKVRGFLSKLV